MALRYSLNSRLPAPSNGVDRRTLAPRPGAGYQKRQRRDDYIYIVDRSGRIHKFLIYLLLLSLLILLVWSLRFSLLLSRVGFVCLTNLIHHYLINHLHSLLTTTHSHLLITHMSHLVLLVITSFPYSTLVRGADIDVQEDDFQDGVEHVDGEEEEDMDMVGGGMVAEVRPLSSGSRPGKGKGVGFLRDTTRSVMGFTLASISLAVVILNVGFHRHLFKLLVMVQSFLWILEHHVLKNLWRCSRMASGAAGQASCADARDLRRYYSLLHVCILIYLID
ncbi:hypothetical protein M9H77_03643 [Catharanthus roseus]|uniref:Uncharacterized protein n=1 Tax=Catharanthus roseus TaxID=4058 RepID=A0ACC0CBW8_CATRO|nr:hypothetical protein M9H77_03643 [Catharanthus roseus]